MSVYKALVVRSAQIRQSDSSKQTYFECELEDAAGEKTTFRLIIDGCVGEDSYRSQYEMMKAHFIPGALISCGVAYLNHDCHFSMVMYDFLPLQAVNLDNNEPISADTYFNRNRGFWTTARPCGNRVHLPGLIHLEGKVHIPIVENGPLPHVEQRYGNEKGLRWGSPPSIVLQILKMLFGRRRGPVFAA